MRGIIDRIENGYYIIQDTETGAIIEIKDNGEGFRERDFVIYKNNKLTMYKDPETVARIDNKFNKILKK